MSVNESFCSYEEFQEFEKWAFGKVGNYYDMDTLDLWNFIHGDILLIKSDELIHESLKKMKALWEEHKMDKQIHKVEKDIKQNKKKKAEKDVKKLLKMDKKFDAKIEKCDKKMKMK